MLTRMIIGLLASLILLLSVRGMVRQQDPDTVNFRLNKLEIVGLQKLSREKFLELSGLKLEQSLKLADLRPVADKLYSSSLFVKVRYRYSWMGDLLDVFFDVEEAPPVPPQPSLSSEPKPLTLGKIEFTGLQRCDRATAIQATGLQIGAPFDQKQLNAAAKSLTGSGYFSEVNYNYRLENDQGVALFEVVEFKWDIPCIFDNFVWFTPQELRDAVRKEIPSFEGASPDNEVIPNEIKSALEYLLRLRGIGRGVNFMVSSGNIEDPADRAKKEFLFVSTGAPIPVCQITFPGASAALQKQMQAAIKPLVNLDYSSRQFGEYLEKMLLPIYRQRGYLRSRFAGHTAEPDQGASKKCQNGVNVSAPVAEGVVYKLGKFEWAGNQAIDMSAMQDLLGMKAGATADGARIDKGLNAIRAAYLNRGYLDLKLEIKTDFDESSRTANYHIAVTEGQPFLMGEVVIANASESEQKRIRGKWQLAQGSILNFGYVREFVKKLSEDRSGRVPRVDLRLNRPKQTADVVFTF
jgi:outer membrane protein assembly factor BamA